jgi:hypothetical protein
VMHVTKSVHGTESEHHLAIHLGIRKTEE